MHLRSGGNVKGAYIYKLAAINHANSLTMKKTILLFLLILFSASFGYGQIPAELNNYGNDKFVYFLIKRLYNFDITNTPEQRFDFKKTWLDIYGNSFYKEEYKQAKQNEFTRKATIERIKEEINGGAAQINFSNPYYVNTTAELSEYNFDRETFTLSYLKTEVGLTSKDFDIRASLAYFVNYDDFNTTIQVKTSKAQKIVAAFSNNKRQVQAKLIFNFVNQPIYESPRDQFPFTFNIDRIGFNVYLKKIELYSNAELFATILPNEEYEDPINGYKSLNGEEVINFKNETIKLTRENGNPKGAITYYTNKGNISRILSASKWFPTCCILDGTCVWYKTALGGSSRVIREIAKYSEGRLNGYDIISEQYYGKTFLVKRYEDGNLIETLKPPPIQGETYSRVDRGIKEINFEECPQEVQNIILEYDLSGTFAKQGGQQSQSPAKKTSDKPELKDNEVSKNLGTKQYEMLNQIDKTHNFKPRIKESTTIDSFSGKFISAECKKGYFEFYETDITNSEVKTNRRNCISLLGNEKLTYKYDNGVLFYELGNYTKNGKLVFNVMIVFIDTNNELVVVNYATADNGDISATERKYKKE